MVPVDQLLHLRLKDLAIDEYVHLFCVLIHDEILLRTCSVMDAMSQQDHCYLEGNVAVVSGTSWLFCYVALLSQWETQNLFLKWLPSQILFIKAWRLFVKWPTSQSQVKSIPEHSHVTADRPEYCHITADLPESHHISADFLEQGFSKSAFMGPNITSFCVWAAHTTIVSLEVAAFTAEPRPLYSPTLIPSQHVVNILY